MKVYEIEQVRRMAELCYGKPVSDRTWRRWRHSIGIKCKEHQVKTLSEKQALWLSGYAYLKRQQPRGKYVLSDVVNMFNSNPNLQHIFYSIDFQQNGFLGRDLPAIVEHLTGKKISLRTFYRIGKKQNLEFSINSIYDNSTINIFLAAIE